MNAVTSPRALNLTQPLHMQSIGQGPDVILLHGWGMNSAVFTPLQAALPEYRLHFIDLPGFGFSPVIEGGVEDWIDAIVEMIPDNSILLGWSLGGLLASQIAMRYPHKVSHLVTVASSPCFVEKMVEQTVVQTAQQDLPWPGIAPQVLAQFHQSLSLDLKRTIDQFLSIQAMGSESARADVRALKALIYARPQAAASALAQGLSILANTDLRQEVANIEQPWLRIWGRLDGLVPQAVAKSMPQKPTIRDVVIDKASHAPFISHPQVFLSALNSWLTR